MREFKISKEENNIRLDKYVRKILPNAPLSVIYKLFRKKDIKVNGKPASDKLSLKENDMIRIYLLEEQFQDFCNEKKKEITEYHFDVVYEDENIFVVSKPTGMVVQDAENVNENTLTEEVQSYFIEKGLYDPKDMIAFAPSPAHRIDRNTSGLVIFGKNIESLQILNKAFKERTGINKKYLALVFGKTKKEGEINLPLIKNENEKLVRVDMKYGKSALTRYKTLLSNEKYSLLEVELLTGRTHQIRVHMSNIGFPLVGDKKYGNFKGNLEFEKEYDWKFQFLHAYYISFLGLEGKLSYLNGKVIKKQLDDKKSRIIDEIFTKK